MKTAEGHWLGVEPSAAAGLLSTVTTTISATSSIRTWLRSAVVAEQVLEISSLWTADEYDMNNEYDHNTTTIHSFTHIHHSLLSFSVSLAVILVLSDRIDLMSH